MSQIKFGVMSTYRGDYADDNLEEMFRNANSLGVKSMMFCLLANDKVRDDLINRVDEVKGYMKKYDVEVNALWAGWGAPCFWNFYEGQNTIGLIPPEYREKRLQLVLNASKIAKAWGVKYIVTHCGYIPENPNDPVYNSFIAMMKYLCGELKNRGQWFCFETGQETPITILRAIQDIGTGNIGVNLDTANIILYGKANPVDAIKIIGDYVKCLHLKDGLWPTDGRSLGKMVQIGQGEVDFPAVVKGLHDHGYRGHFTIEREIQEGSERNQDIIDARDMIMDLTSKYEWDPE